MTMLNGRVCGLLILLSSSTNLYAAVVSKVLTPKKLIIANLDDTEDQATAKGSEITIVLKSGNELIGIVKAHKGKKAVIKLESGIEKVKTGMSVTIIASGSQPVSKQGSTSNVLASSENLFLGEYRSFYNNNPATMVHVNKLSTIASGAFVSINGSAESDVYSIESKVSGIIMNVDAVYHQYGFALGAGAAMTSAKSETSGSYVDIVDEDFDSEGSGTYSVFTFKAAYTGLRNISLGFSAEQASENDTYKTKDEKDTKSKVTNTSFKPGVLFYNSRLQAGLTYTPTINIQDEDGSKSSAGSVLFEGEIFLTGTTSATLSIENVRHSAIDDEESKDITNFGLGVTQRFGAFRLITSAHFNPAYYKDSDSAYYHNTASITIYAGAVWNINRLMLGADFEYNTHPEVSIDDATYSENQILMALSIGYQI